MSFAILNHFNSIMNINNVEDIQHFPFKIPSHFIDWVMGDMESSCWLFPSFVILLSCHVGMTVELNRIVIEGAGHYLFVDGSLPGASQLLTLNFLFDLQWSAPRTQLFNFGQHLNCKNCRKILETKCHNCGVWMKLTILFRLTLLRLFIEEEFGFLSKHSTRLRQWIFIYFELLLYDRNEYI